MQDLQEWPEQSQSSEDYKQLTLEMFEAAPQWLAERRVNVKWKPLSSSSDMERKSSICLRVRQISASPAVARLSDVPKVVQSLDQLTNSIQKQQSPHLRPFVEGEIQFVGYTDQHDMLQAMLTLKKRKNVEMGLDQITGLILVAQPVCLLPGWCGRRPACGALAWKELLLSQGRKSTQDFGVCV